MPVSRKLKKKKGVARPSMGRILPPVDITNTNDLGELDKRLQAGPITLVFVYADWCGHCQRYKPNMEELENMSNRSVQTVRIRDDMFPKSSINHTKIEGYPSLLLIKPRDNKEENPQPVVFEQENGETTNVIPDHHNMKNMGAIVANAGTPDGLKILDKANVNKNNIVAINKSNGILIRKLNNQNANNTTRKHNSAIVKGMPLATAESESKSMPTILTPMPIINKNLEDSSDSSDRSENTIVYTPLSVSPGTPPNITLNRKTANKLVAEEEDVEQASTILSQQGQRGGLMSMLSRVAYQHGPASALFLMANVKDSSGKKTKKKNQKIGHKTK
jgi:thiol-disulfide isomerase/thioredoxin